MRELDSYMFQTVGHEAIQLYAEAMRLPLFRGDIKRLEKPRAQTCQRILNDLQITG